RRAVGAATTTPIAPADVAPALLCAPPISHYARPAWARRRSRITPVRLTAPPIAHYARPAWARPISHYACPLERAADLALRPSAWARRRSRITPVRLGAPPISHYACPL